MTKPDFIAEKIRDAVMRAIVQEAFLVAGRHMEREGGTGPFRLREGCTKQTLANDIGTLIEHATFCARGVGFAIRVKETQEQGVSFDLTVQVSPDQGRSLVERG